MFSRLFVTVQLVALAAVWAARADETKVFSGTFKDTAGHTGPLQCALVSKEGGKWTADFSAKNTGEGPKRSAQYSGELTGKTEGESTTLSGVVVVQRQGPFDVTAVLTDKSLKATFKKKAGGGDGTFDLVPGKSEALAAQPEPKKEEPKPKATP